jgi:hypothetical protein
VPHAHTERWLYAAAFAEPSDGDPWYGRAQDYFHDRTIVEEILAAYGKSFGSPAFRDRKNAVFGRNDFAFCFHMMKNQDLARRELDAIGSRSTETPWGFLGSPTVAFRDARRAAGLPV